MQTWLGTHCHEILPSERLMWLDTAAVRWSVGQPSARRHPLWSSIESSWCVMSAQYKQSRSQASWTDVGSLVTGALSSYRRCCVKRNIITVHRHLKGKITPSSSSSYRCQVKGETYAMRRNAQWRQLFHFRSSFRQDIFSTVITAPVVAFTSSLFSTFSSSYYSL